jgi:diacylglycerol kinase family enzyme
VRRAAIVYNPIRVDLPRLKRTVATWEAKAGWAESLWLATTLERPTSELVAEALEVGVELVIAAGGDGTVSETASALRQERIPLGILPCGTANLLARNLRLPLSNLGAATRIAFTGADRSMDVGMLSYRLVDGSSGIRPFFGVTS